MHPREPIKPGNLTPTDRQKVITITNKGHQKGEEDPGTGASTYWEEFKSFVSMNPPCTVQDWLNHLEKNPILQPKTYTVKSHLEFDEPRGFIKLTDSSHAR